MARRLKTGCEKAVKVDVCDVASDLMADSMPKLLARPEQDEACLLDLLRLGDEPLAGESGPILGPAGDEKMPMAFSTMCASRRLRCFQRRL